MPIPPKSAPTTAPSPVVYTFSTRLPDPAPVAPPPPRLPPGRYRLHDSSRGLLEGVLVVLCSDTAGGTTIVEWRWDGQRTRQRCVVEELEALGTLIRCADGRRA